MRSVVVKLMNISSDRMVGLSWDVRHEEDWPSIRV